jgi:predicted negative regulator of RcsB-dependent stress response
MRKFFTLLWLLFPVGVVYYHFNEGQTQLAREAARDHLLRIRALEQAKEPDWPTIVEEYDKLAAALPPGESPTVRHQVRLAKAKAKVEMLDVAGAINDLSQLLKESAAVDGEDGATTRAIRETLGKAYFYATSLLKANGATEEEWRPYAERTRQVFRYLAEHQDPAALADYERRVEAEFARSVRQNSL